MNMRPRDLVKMDRIHSAPKTKANPAAAQGIRAIAHSIIARDPAMPLVSAD